MKLARVRSSKELVAVKVFTMAMTEENFYRELCIGSKMKHRNLLSYHLGLQKPQFAITMD